MQILGSEMRRKIREARLQGYSMLRSRVLFGVAVVTCGLVTCWSVNGWSDAPPQGGMHHHHPAVAEPPQKQAQQSSPAKQQAGLATPKGWRFTLPPGNPRAGRQVFVDFECFKCHEVAGEDFPAPKAEQGDVGSTLSGMGGMHPAEYFAEAMIDPNASVVWRIKHHKTENKGYLGPDGASKMPSYNDTMTIQQLIDLVAYLKSLIEGGHRH